MGNKQDAAITLAESLNSSSRAGVARLTSMSTEGVPLTLRPATLIHLGISATLANHCSTRSLTTEITGC